MLQVETRVRGLITDDTFNAQSNHHPLSILAQLEVAGSN